MGVYYRHADETRTQIAQSLERRAVNSDRSFKHMLRTLDKDRDTWMSDLFSGIRSFDKRDRQRHDDFNAGRYVSPYVQRTDAP